MTRRATGATDGPSLSHMRASVSKWHDYDSLLFTYSHLCAHLHIIVDTPGPRLYSCDCLFVSVDGTKKKKDFLMLNNFDTINRRTKSVWDLLMSLTSDGGWLVEAFEGYAGASVPSPPTISQPQNRVAAPCHLQFPLSVTHTAHRGLNWESSHRML